MARILVVEDEIVVAMDIQKSLTSLGYSSPDVVFTGSDAVQIAVETHPDLVLMDIRLKGDMDGIEAAEQIRRRLGIPVVAIVDTNCDPEVIDHPVPGNDDAIRSITLITRLMSDAVLEGGEGREPEQPSEKAETRGVEEERATQRRPGARRRTRTDHVRRKHQNAEKGASG